MLRCIVDLFPGDADFCIMAVDYCSARSDVKGAGKTRIDKTTLPLLQNAFEGQPMKFELRKIHHSPSLSEETNAYTADLYVDGKLLAHVSNQGHGGCDMQHPAKGRTYDDIKAAEAWIKANIPATTHPQFIIDGKPMVIEPDLESICGDLLADHLIERDLNRLLKRTIAFVPADTNEVRSYRGKHEGVGRAHLITETLRKYPGAKILNNLPLDEAKALYKATAGK